MKGVTEITNRHLLPVGREPMIWHPVRQLVAARMRSGIHFGCQFKYRVQEEARGMAHGLLLSVGNTIRP